MAVSLTAIVHLVAVGDPAQQVEPAGDEYHCDEGPAEAARTDQPAARWHRPECRPARAAPDVVLPVADWLGAGVVRASGLVAVAA